MTGNESEDIRLGILYLDEKKYKEAEREFQKALEAEPVNGTALVKLGHVYLQQKDYVQAEAMFKRLLECYPQRGDAYEGLGLCYFEENRIDQALTQFSRALEFSPESEHTYFGIGLCYQQKKEFKKAIEAFEQVLRLNPRHQQVNPQLAQCYQGMGHAYFQEKNYSQAEAMFKRLLECYPQRGDAYEGLGLCYFEENRIDQALTQFSRALEFSPESEHTYFGIGLCYQQKKEFKKAIEAFEQVLRLNPRHQQVNPQLAQCYQGMGHAYFQEKNYSQAEAMFKRALAMNPRFFSAHRDLGCVYLEKRLYVQAKEEFEEAIRLNSKDAAALQWLGYAYKNTGKPDLAVDAFIQATELYLQANEEKKAGLLQKRASRDATKEKSKELTVLILRVPSFNNKNQIDSTELNCCLLPPLALGQISGYLRSHGFKVDQDDLNIKVHYDNYFSKNTEKEIDVSIFFDEARVLRYLAGAKDDDLELLMEKIDKKTAFRNHCVILFSFSVIPNSPSDIMFILCLSRFIKKRYEPVLALGGCNHSIELLLQYNAADIDFLFYGDGGGALLDLLQSLENGKEPDSISGPRTKKDNKIIFSGVFPPLKPDFSGMPLEYYHYKGTRNSYEGEAEKIIKDFHESKTLLLPFKFIKSCPFDCIFCAESANRSVYALGPSGVARYLSELQEAYRPTGFFFLSDTINISKSYINELCDEIIENKIKIQWSDCARADNLDRETLLKMRQAGCIRLIFGMETASQRLLKYVDKRISVTRLENVLKWADQAGIWTGIEIICGFPHETDKDVDDTIAFLKKHRDHINTVYPNQFSLRFGSVMMQDPRSFGIENIVELNQYPNDEFNDFHKYGYDEVKGLKWHDKCRQIAASYNKMVEAVSEFDSAPVYELEYLLFFLYDKFGDKKRVSEAFRKIAKEKNSVLCKLVLQEGKVC